MQKTNCENFPKGHVPIQPGKAGIKLGIDTYMDKYPQWFQKYFPTLLRCEKTHFISYFQSPSGKVVALLCPQPIASWSIDFNKGYMDPPPHWFMGHRIDSVNLDFINQGPLPARHLAHLYQIKQGESKTWELSLIPLENLKDFELVTSAQLQAPVFELTQTTCAPEESVSILLHSQSQPELSVIEPSGKSQRLKLDEIAPQLYKGNYSAQDIGLVQLIATAGGEAGRSQPERPSIKAMDF